MRDAWWTSHDERKHVKCTRDGNGNLQFADTQSHIFAALCTTFS